VTNANNGTGSNGDGKPKDGAFVIDLSDYTEDSVLFPAAGDGMPWRGPINTPHKPNDPAHLQPVVTSDFKTRIFDLSDKKQRNDYDVVLSVVHSSESMMLYRDDLRWVEEKQSWMALIQWVENYHEDPKNSARAAYDRLRKRTGEDRS